MTEALEIPFERYMEARRRRFDRVRDLDLLLGDDTVLVMPTMCVEGFTPDGRLPGADRPAGGSAYNTDPQNVSGHPALSVPAGILDNGIPFGLQVTGPRFRDDLVLNVGGAWEAANPWPLAAPGYEPFLADGA
jgi:Asp-tRNA(Asn)/Glu-tRNA(Gln) amidotransferase A subunit family amidase